MVMTTLERAARALCEKAGYNPDEPVLKGEPIQYHRRDMRPIIATCPRWQTYQDQVRAVITAIREPSDAVLLAMREPLGKHVDGHPVSHGNTDKFRAAIDAILEEG